MLPSNLLWITGTMLLLTSNVTVEPMADSTDTLPVVDDDTKISMNCSRDDDPRCVPTES
jgi:hypothetical protein